MKKLFFLLAILLAIVLVSVSCGTSGPETTATTTTSTSKAPQTSTTSSPSQTITTTSTPTASDADKYGGTLKLVLWASPSGTGGLPWELFGNDLISSHQVIEPLLHVDGNSNIVPCLAESYSVADDLLSITFKLRKGVKFHDGTELNAEAAKWNLDHTIAKKSQPSWKSVDVIDDYTIRLNLNYWTNTIVTSMDSASSWMVSPSAYEKNGEEWMRNNPVGTGPFKFLSFERDVSYKAVRNPDYWMEGKPYLDEIDVLYIGDPMTQKAALQSGEADVLQIEPAKMAYDLKNLGFNIDVTVTSTFMLLPDTVHESSPFAEKKVREAVEYALDREAIANAFSYGFWSAAYQIASPSASGVYNPDFVPSRTRNVEKAKELLTEAGFPNGFTATLSVIPVGIDRNIAVAIQNNLADAGIIIEINIPAAIPKWLEDSNTLENVLLMQPVFGGSNWNSALAMAFRPGMTMMNSVWLRTPEFIELYNASQNAPAMDADLIKAVLNYMYEEALVVPVMNGGTGFASQSYVMDAGFNNRGAGWVPENAWIKK